MNQANLNFWINVLSLICWPACFWWMYRISVKQNSLLDQLKEQTERIERFSKVEHDLIREVHPKVGEIRDGMEEMIAAVKETVETAQPKAPPARRPR